MTLDPALVQALTVSVLPQGLAVVARDPRNLPTAVDPAEQGAVAHAVPARVAEFHAGRAAARAAMVQLSLPPRPVPMGPDRAPLWPAGVTGSISHSATACVAVLGHSHDWAGIGVDLEEATRLDPDLVPQICTLAEQSWLRAQPEVDRGVMAKLLFSIKEAAYKAQYPLTQNLFGFDGFEVQVDRARSQFSAKFRMQQGGFDEGTMLAGNFAHAAGLLVTAVALDRPYMAQLLRVRGDKTG